LHQRKSLSEGVACQELEAPLGAYPEKYKSEPLGRQNPLFAASNPNAVSPFQVSSLRFQLSSLKFQVSGFRIQFPQRSHQIELWHDAGDWWWILVIEFLAWVPLW
jgi:hypothetical protein